MIAVYFFVTVFAQAKVMSQIILSLTIFEVTVLDCNLFFHTIFGELIQAYEGTTNGMTQRTTDAIVLEPNGNNQRGITHFSLSKGRIL